MPFKPFPRKSSPSKEFSEKKSLNLFRRGSVNRRAPSPPTHLPPADEPPPYEPEPTTLARQPSYLDIPHDSSKYKALSKFDTVFLIDDSGSMMGSRWQQTSEALAAIVPTCTTQDADGVDIYFLNHRNSHRNVRDSKQVLKIFSSVMPSGATPTGKRLGEIFARYMKAFEADRSIKPLNVIVITDGEPTDPGRLEDEIVRCAKSLDNMRAEDRQIGVQFFQVGSDEAATESLEELDNALVEQWHIRDMVDTVSWKKLGGGDGLTADEVLKVVMGAVDKHLDRKRRF